jgi:hypothetical protein
MQRLMAALTRAGPIDTMSIMVPKLFPNLQGCFHCMFIVTIDPVRCVFSVTGPGFFRVHRDPGFLVGHLFYTYQYFHICPQSVLHAYPGKPGAGQ